MKKITDELLKTHLVIRTVMGNLDPDDVRFPNVLETLQRTIFAHGWLQDEILGPVLEDHSLIMTPLLREIQEGHMELQRIIKHVDLLPLEPKEALHTEVTRLKTAIEAHLTKESVSYYPLVEKVLDAKTLERLANEIADRQAEFAEVTHV